jgi:DNA-binding transcriptional regulator LsrR (DeoR family)
MPRSRFAPDWYLLSKVSTLYYIQHQTQQQIAQRLGVSRPTVSRLRQDAQDHGIAQFTVATQRGVCLELEG